MNELDFTIEFHSEFTNKEFETDLMAEAEQRLRKLARGHSDMTGAAVNMRQPAKKVTPPLHEATIVVYTRPEHIAATEKADTPQAALKGALEAVERQIRQKRDKLGRPWEKPGNDPVSQEVLELIAAEEMPAEEIEAEEDPELSEIPDAEEQVDER